MIKWNILAVSVLLLVGCGTSRAPAAPDAALYVPACVVVPATVVLDASGSLDPDGDIDRYVFKLGHRFAPVVVDVPRVSYRFDKAYKVGGILRPLPVSVTVVDVTGLEGTVTTQFWLVDNAADCDTVGPLPDVVVQPDIEQDSVDQDVFLDIGVDGSPADLVGDSAVDVSDFQPQDTAPDVAVDVGPDVQPPDVLPDGIPSCPELGKTYTVKVRCDGVVEAVMDLNITQVGCTFKDSYGVIQGSMTGNQATVESTFTELKIQQCSGAIEDANLFVLLCESGCTSEYSLKQ